MHMSHLAKKMHDLFSKGFCIPTTVASTLLPTKYQ